MRCNVISDLHLEFADLELPGGDVLILGGDVCEAKNIKLSEYNRDLVTSDRARRPDRYARFFIEECAKYRKVIYIMGNHEHYGYEFDKTYNYLKSVVPDNVVLLEKEYYDLDGVRFIGGTLWTDLNRNNPLTEWDLKNNMNDYRVIRKKYSKDQYGKLNPQVTHGEHRKTIEFIHQSVKSAGKMPCVVVTHHYPSKQSIHAQYQNDYHMNGGFGSDLDDFIIDHPEIQVWTHGHTHDPFNYKIGNTRVICNPRGYTGYESRTRDFSPLEGFDI